MSVSRRFSRADRFTFLGLGAIAAWLALGLLDAKVPMPKCAFRAWTGLYCPGCGGTRAARALLSGDLIGALRQNALLPLTLAVVVVALVRGVRSAREARPMSWHIGGRAAQAAVLVVLGYAVLRNLPFPALDALRPT